MDSIFDVIVLGGGPGGYLAAERAGHAGLKTLLIEKRALGGTCLNEGCIPSKAFLHSAKVFDYASHGEKYGVSANDVTIDHSKVLARKNTIVKNLVNGVGAVLKQNHVTVEYGEGYIEGKNSEGYNLRVNGKNYRCKNLIIATGSTALIPPIAGIKEAVASGFALTNKEILDIENIPKILCVIGGGVIGIEMASYFNSVGCKVTVIEMMNKIAGPTDDEISSILQKNYAKKGVDFKLGAKVTAFGADYVQYEENGESKKISVHKVLLSIGRRPLIQNFGLENINLATERGAILTDEQLRTNIPNVYAIGDVNGKLMLAHTAYREAEVAVNTILGKKDAMDYSAIASVIYTNPEVGCVGETEQSAKKKGYQIKTAKITMNFSGRYMAENENGDGICKIVVDTKNDRLLGVHLIGNYSSEIIYGASIMIEKQMPVDAIKKLVFPHPTVAEIIREAIFTL